MRVFIRDEDGQENRYTCKPADKKGNIVFNTKDESFILSSLDHHDLEIRADERKKVIAELEQWVEKNKTLVVWGTNNHNNFERIKYFDLQQKLTELKGEYV